MEKIYTSATKIIFILTGLTVCVGFFLKLVPVEQFMTLATLVFSFYYAGKRPEVKPTELG